MGNYDLKSTDLLLSDEK